MLRTVQATRYVTPLREGGSLPAIVEGGDLGLYVVKFRGAGQGPLALVAELVAGEIARALELRVPELVFVEIDALLGRNEPDYEIRSLLRASVGRNLALDFLPGSTMFDPAARDTADVTTASMAVWFDGFVQNVDRTPRNPNLIRWHKQLYFIDHGAALYFHHDWGSAAKAVEARFPAIREHVLLPWASAIPAAAERARQMLSAGLFHDILAMVPDAWLLSPREGADGSHGNAALEAEERRNVYVDILTRRLGGSQPFVEEAMRARAQLV